MIEGCSFDWPTRRRDACDNTRNESWPQLGAGRVLSDGGACEVSSYSTQVHRLSSVSKR